MRGSDGSNAKYLPSGNIKNTLESFGHNVEERGITTRKDYLNGRTLPAKAMGSSLLLGRKPVNYTVKKYNKGKLRGGWWSRTK